MGTSVFKILGLWLQSHWDHGSGHRQDLVRGFQARSKKTRLAPAGLSHKRLLPSAAFWKSSLSGSILQVLLPSRDNWNKASSYVLQIQTTYFFGEKQSYRFDIQNLSLSKDTMGGILEPCDFDGSGKHTVNYKYQSF